MRGLLFVLALVLMFASSAALAHPEGANEGANGSPDETAQALAAHRIALANARDRVDELQSELASARREMRRTAVILDALGVDPSASPGEVVAGLIDRASGVDGDPQASGGLALLPLGDQVNRLSLYNQVLRQQIGERDQEIQGLLDRRQRDAELRAREDEAERLARIEADSVALAPPDEPRAAPPAPRWEYTWQKARIYTGEATSTTYHTLENGRRVEHVDESPAYDNGRVRMTGTFRNESQSPYQYTFKVVAYAVLCGHRTVQGYEWVQTPVLSPGELFCWEVVFGVDDVDVISDGDVVRVDATLGE